MLELNFSDIELQLSNALQPSASTLSKAFPTTLLINVTPPTLPREGNRRFELYFEMQNVSGVAMLLVRQKQTPTLHFFSYSTLQTATASLADATMSDKDSLFGSPPPSPARGRSPSLALPESSEWRLDAQTSSQNVGTIALPGSQKHSSELPVFLNPALPSVNSVLKLRPPAQPAQPAQPAKAPQRRRQRASNTAHSVPRMPSPSPHTTRTDQTLRDLVGLISHFEPVPPPSSSRPPPITAPFLRANQALEAPLGSAQNPIEIDDSDPICTPGPADAVNSALVALAGTVAGALRLPTTPHETLSISKPTVNNVLHCIKHDPKLIPALQATYEYLGSISNNSQPPPRSFSHATKPLPEPLSSTPRKRKRGHPQVPAGAGHWDVPFPFEPGTEPRGYSNWHLERGRRVLGELLGLFERGFAKARGETASTVKKNPSRQRPKKQRIRAVESVPGHEIEGPQEGITDREAIPDTSAGGGGLDYQRMANWLSSVPPLTSSTIVDSTNLSNIPSPSPSDPTTPSTNSLLDFMATLGPTFPDSLVTDGDEKQDTFDYAKAFDEFDTGIGDADMDWQALLGSEPPSQSINDIMAFSIPELQSPAIETGAEGLLHDSAMTLSQQLGNQTSHCAFLSPEDHSAPLPMTSQDPAFLTAASDALASLMQSAAGPSRHLHAQSVASGTSRDLDLGDSAFLPLPFVDAFVAQNAPPHAAQSLDAHSLLTVPTASGSSSRRGSTPIVIAQDSMSPDLSVNMGLPPPGKTKVERRAAILAKAKEHREQLIKELERVQVQRWELLIEGGVLRNLEKTADVQ